VQTADPLADTDADFFELWTDSRSTVHEKLCTWIDADPVPSISLPRMLFLTTAKKH